ncbi:MetQ/NlpA family ABC transporter substrate-binding protein [uncultured Parasutterella sp.]|nr:MetQ/NlpA family ABC transporter substrate-binding protein [uncultured Parasutterella sp.]
MIIAARENNANNADVQKFVKAFQSPEVAKFIKEEFKGAVVPAWE